MALEYLGDIRVLRLLNSSVQISFEFKHDAATKLVHGQGKARDVTHTSSGT